jgi:hypothetical protein
MGSTQPLTEMSTRNLPEVKGRPAHEADNLTAICEQIVCNNVGDSTSQNPMGLHRDSFIFFLFFTPITININFRSELIAVLSVSFLDIKFSSYEFCIPSVVITLSLNHGRLGRDIVLISDSSV